MLLPTGNFDLLNGTSQVSVPFAYKRLYSLLWSHLKLVSEFQMKVMKLSLVSLVATVLAAIAGSGTAAPVPRPFERDVNIYSRAYRKARKAAVAFHHSTMTRCREAAILCHAAGEPNRAQHHELNYIKNEKDKAKHIASMNGGRSHPLASIEGAKLAHQDADADIKRLRRLVIPRC